MFAMRSHVEQLAEDGCPYLALDCIEKQLTTARRALEPDGTTWIEDVLKERARSNTQMRKVVQDEIDRLSSKLSSNKKNMQQDEISAITAQLEELQINKEDIERDNKRFQERSALWKTKAYIAICLKQMETLEGYRDQLQRTKRLSHITQVGEREQLSDILRTQAILNFELYEDARDRLPLVRTAALPTRSIDAINSLDSGIREENKAGSKDKHLIPILEKLKHMLREHHREPEEVLRENFLDAILQDKGGELKDTGYEPTLHRDQIESIIKKRLPSNRAYPLSSEGRSAERYAAAGLGPHGLVRDAALPADRQAARASAFVSAAAHEGARKQGHGNYRRCTHQ